MIIDGLTHILPPYFNAHRDDALTCDRTFAELFANSKARIVQAEHLISEMDRSGIDRSVIAGFGWTDLELARRSNDYLLESATRYPNRLIPLCSVNPLWEGNAAPHEAERCLIAGAVGIGELHADTQGWVDAPYRRLSDTLSVASTYNAVVTVHASEPMGHSYPGKGTMTPDRLLRLAELYPHNRFVFSHFGGGLPFFSHMPEVREALKNVWFDSAASPFLYEPTIYQTAVQSVGKSRIIFASDYPVLSQIRALRHLREYGMTKDTENRVLANAGELYDFSRSNSNE